MSVAQTAVTIHSTHNCVNTPAVLFALEEAGASYTTAKVPDGWFFARFGIPGPGYEESVDDDRWMLVETGAILRHVARAHAPGSLWPSAIRGQAEADRWLEFVGRRVVVAAEKAGDDPGLLTALLGRLDGELGSSGGDWLLGSFTIVDAAAARLLPLRGRLPLDNLHTLASYLDRLAARPSLARARKRAAG
jgi:glutathione S-transferase